MKILFLTNSDVSLPLQHWLKETANEQVVVIQKRLTPDQLQSARPDFTISYNYRFILPDEIVHSLDQNIINLHTSLLPWNRGAAPNVWSFLKETPKGVTIHQLDAGLDTGPILVQKTLMFHEPNETLESTFAQLHQAIQELFKQNWHRIRDHSIVPQPQMGPGSYQSLVDFTTVQHILEPEGWKVPIAVLKQRFAALSE